MGALKTSGKYLTDDFLHSFTKVGRSVFTWGNQTKPSDFLSHDWIMMRVEETSDGGTLHRPTLGWFTNPGPTRRSWRPARIGISSRQARLHEWPNELWWSRLSPNFTQHDINNTGLTGSQGFDHFICPGLNPLPADAPTRTSRRSSMACRLRWMPP